MKKIKKSNIETEWQHEINYCLWTAAMVKGMSVVIHNKSAIFLCIPLNETQMNFFHFLEFRWQELRVFNNDWNECVIHRTMSFIFIIMKAADSIGRDVCQSMKIEHVSSVQRKSHSIFLPTALICCLFMQIRCVFLWCVKRPFCTINAHTHISTCY